ncbi:MAG: hypothetical protein ACRENK_02885 [Gemmatimonadaceae bacterium]
MQTPTPQATPTQAPPVSPFASITTTGANGKTVTLPIPSTPEQIVELQARKEQLSDELSNVSVRRHDLSSELQGTGDDLARNGLRDRISLLDKRILQLETNLEATNNQLASAPPELVAMSLHVDPSRPDDFEHGATIGVFSTLAVCAVVFTLARRNTKRFRRRPTSPLLESDSVQRLQRLESGGSQ